MRAFFILWLVLAVHSALGAAEQQAMPVLLDSGDPAWYNAARMPG